VIPLWAFFLLGGVSLLLIIQATLGMLHWQRRYYELWAKMQAEREKRWADPTRHERR
jgi:hypothetical protein